MKTPAEFKHLIGMTTEDASAALKKDNMKIRIMRRDGEGGVGTCDYIPERVNVAIVDGKVTEIINLG